MDEISLEGSSHLLVTEGFCWSKHILEGLCVWKALEQLEVSGIITVYVALRDSHQTKTTEQPRS